MGADGMPGREKRRSLHCATPGVSSGNWFEGSQVSKARPGAPIGFTLRYSRRHKLCHSLPIRLSESAARDDKGESDGFVKGIPVRHKPMATPVGRFARLTATADVGEILEIAGEFFWNRPVVDVQAFFS
jgi:hypothetical protein